MSGDSLMSFFIKPTQDIVLVFWTILLDNVLYECEQCTHIDNFLIKFKNPHWSGNRTVTQQRRYLFQYSLKKNLNKFHVKNTPLLCDVLWARVTVGMWRGRVVTSMSSCNCRWECDVGALCLPWARVTAGGNVTWSRCGFHELV